MKKCVALKFGRHNDLKMKTSEFVKLVNSDERTIGKMEYDEEYWAEVPQELLKRIREVLPERMKDTNLDEFINDTVEQPEEEIIEIPITTDGLNEQNKKTMTLVEFIFEGLKESKKHSDFAANIGLLNRALSKY